jgi:hypothetical protein
LIVHQSELLTLTANDAQGHPVVAAPVTFTSSNTGILQVSLGGVVTAVARGTATITVKRDTVSARLTLSVKARVMLTPAAGWEWANHVLPSVGDTVQLVANYVDFNGLLLERAQPTDWQSSDPAAVSIDATGLAIALQAGQAATITASTPDGLGVTQIFAQVEGPPISVRFVHAAPSLGPITFHAHGLTPVTLQFGETADMAVTTSDIYVTTDGMPAAEIDRRQLYAGIIPGSTLALFAIQGTNMSGLVAAWGTTDPIPADSGLVRLIQSSNVPVAYLRPSGETGLGRPKLCYFDPGDPSPYYSLPGGAFDVLLQRKVGFTVDSTLAYAQLAASVPAGHAVTLVLTGTMPSSAGFIAFSDR